MEDPRVRLQEELKAAMKGGNTQRRDVIRLAQSAIKQVEVDTRQTLSAEDVVAILQKEAKLRRETIAERQSAGRDITTDEQELAILEGFLPQQLTREEITLLVEQAIAAVGAQGKQEMGKVMGQLMPQVKGRADGGLVNQIVRELLG